MNIFKFGPLPMIMAPDDGASGGSGDNGAGAGDQGAGSGAGADDKGAQGNQGADQGNQGSEGDQGGQGNQPGDQGAGAGADDKGAAAGKKDGKEGEGQTQTFPNDWREQLAKDKDGNVDQKKLKQLQRFNSPHDLNKAYDALTQRIAAGELKAPLAKDAKPEDVAKWRQENGIPEKPEGYMTGLPEGLVFGEQDKAALDPFLKDMHDKNVPPEAVHSALQSYQRAQELAAQAIQDRDLDIANATEDELRAEWQADYRPNINAVNAFLDTNFPAGMKEALMNARLGDEARTPLMHHPDVLRSFASLGRILNPQSTVTHGKTMDSMDAVEDQIKGYEKQMATPAWFKDEKAQAHYRELVTIRDRARSR